MRRRTWKVLTLVGLALLTVLAGATSAHAATIRVPSEFPTIQSAVDGSSFGDTVLVAPGTYFENVVIPRKLTLLSEMGPEVTTIDGQDMAPVVTVTLFVQGATIEGFRITRGFSTLLNEGGGIDIEVDIGMGGRATIRNNIIEYNYALGGAGGLCAVRASTVEDNIIQFNNLQTGDAATSAMEASGIIRRNIIRYNGEPVGGADMLTVLIHGSDTGPSTVVDNVIVDNNRVTGSVVISNGGVIRNNTIANNSNWSGALVVVAPNILPLFGP